MALGQAYARILQELFILATGKVANTPNLSALETLVGPNGEMMQIDEVIDAHMGAQEAQLGKVGVIQAIALNGLGIELTTAQAQGVINDLSKAGLDTWSEVLQWAAASTTGRIADILNNRGEAATHFTDALAAQGKTDLFEGASVGAAVTNLLHGIGESAASLGVGKEGLGELADAISAEGIDSSVIDGYVAGAFVFADANGNGVHDDGEWSDVTDASGNYKLPRNAAPGTIIASGGTDLLTGAPFQGVLTAPAGSKVVNPLTTLVQELVASGLAATVADASAIVMNALDLPSVNPLTYDPLKVLVNADSNDAAKGRALDVQSTMLQISNVITQAANALTSASGDGSNNTLAGAAQSVTSALASALVDADADGGIVNLSNTGILSAVFEDAATLNSATTGVTIPTTLTTQLASITAASNTSASNATTIGELSKAAVVSQGSATNAIIAGAGNGNLDSAVSGYTGASLNTAVNGAPPGFITPTIPAGPVTPTPAPPPSPSPAPAPFTLTHSGDTWTAAPGASIVTITADGTHYVFTPDTGTATSVLKTDLATLVIGAGSGTVGGAAEVLKTIPAITGKITVGDTGDIAAASLLAIDEHSSGLVDATSVTGITGGLDDIDGVLANAGTSGNKINVAASLALTLDRSGSFDASVLSAFSARTSGLFTAPYVTEISGNAAENKAVIDLLGTSGDKINLGTMSGELTDVRITVTDEGSVEAAVLNALDAATSGDVHATPVPAITGTLAEVTTTLVTNAGSTALNTNTLCVTLTDADGTDMSANALRVITDVLIRDVRVTNAVDISGNASDIHNLVSGNFIGETANLIDTGTSGVGASTVETLLQSTEGSVTVGLKNDYAALDAALSVASGDVLNLDPAGDMTALNTTPVPDEGDVDAPGDWYFNPESNTFSWWDSGDDAKNALVLSTESVTVLSGGDKITFADASFTVMHASDVVSFGGTATGTISLAIDEGGVGTFSRQGRAADTTVDDVQDMTIEGYSSLTLASALTTGLTFHGGAGYDTVTLADATNLATLTLVDVELVAGGSAADTITFMGTHSVRVEGRGGDDTITGSDGDDAITGGAGIDDLDGGAGNDLFIYTAASELGTGEHIDGGTSGFDTIQLNDSGTYDFTLAVVSGIDRIEFRDKSAPSYTAITLSDNFNGDDDNVEITSGGSTVTTSLLIDASDFSGGTAALNVSGTFDGDDEMMGGSGADTLNGGGGNDTLTGGGGDDVLDGGDGDNMYIYDSGQFVEGETLTGGSSQDRVVFTGDDETIGDDAFEHKTGIEELQFADGNNNVTLGSDAALATNNLRVSSGSGNDVIDASGLGESLEIDAGNGHNTLTGGSGNDTITGGDGNDIITGGGGADVLVGGNGTNTFVFKGHEALAALVSLTGGSGTDYLIIDTEASDIVDTDFANIAANTLEQLTLTGASAIVVGTKAAAAGLATGHGVIRIGSGNTSITANDGEHFTVQADELATDATLTLADGGTSNFVVTGLTGVLNASGLAGSLSVTTEDDPDNVISITSGTGALTLTASGNDNLDIFAGEMSEDHSLTLAGSSNTVDVWSLSSDLVASNLTGMLYVSLIDATDDAITITAGAADLDIWGAADGDTVTVTGFLGSTLVASGGSATTTAKFNITAGAGGQTITTDAGDDTITGSGGADALNGGEGNDLFIIADRDELFGLGSLNGGDGTDTILINTATTSIVDDDFHSRIDSIERIALTGASSIEIGTSAEERGLDTVVTGTGNTSITVIDNHNYAVDAALLAESATLTLIDGGITHVTGLTGSLVVNSSNGVNVTTADAISNTIAITIGGGTAWLTAFAADDTVTVNAAAMRDDTLFTVSGSGYVAITDLQGNLDASALTGNLEVDGTTAAQSLTGGAGSDTISGGGGADTILGGDGDDSVTFDSLANLQAVASVNGGDGFDTLRIFAAGTVTDAEFEGVTAIEKIQVGANGASVLTLGTHATTLATHLTDALEVLGGNGNDVIYASDFDNRINIDAGDGDNLLGGTDHDDTLIGGSGDDVFYGGDGEDSITGGNGSNTYDYDAGQFIAGETIVGGNGIDTIRFTTDDQVVVDADFEHKSGIDAIELADGNNDVTLGTNAKSATANLTVTSGSGNDLINASGLGEGITINAGGGNDTLYGSNESDTINGDEGNDTITGGDGLDNLDGGNGDDVFIFNTSAEFVSDYWMIDWVTGGEGTDTIQINGPITLAATDGLDRLASVERLAAGSESSASRTQSIVLDDDDNVGGLSMIDLSGDTHIGSTATIDLRGSTNPMQLKGIASGGNTITGGSGNDFITGGAGDDTLTGGAGNDTLTGGAGNDTIYIGGETESDTVWIGAVASHGIDVINGFEGDDRIGFVEHPVSYRFAGDQSGNGSLEQLLQGLSQQNGGSCEAVSFVYNERYYVLIGMNSNYNAETDAVVELVGSDVNLAALTQGNFTY